MAFPDDDYAPDAFEVRVSELLVATAESSDSLIDDSVPEVLRLLRQHMHMDVVFVSEFVDGQRVFRRVVAKPDARVIEPGQSSPLEDTFCQRVVDGRLPRLAPDVAALPAALALPRTEFAVGAYMSTPIVLNDGRVYGTLCCFSFAPNDALTQRDLKKLEMSAQLAARKINEQRAREADKAMADWSLEPQKDPWRQR